MAADAQAKFVRATPAESRQALMPFLWSVVATQGQLFGNRDLGSDSHVTNIFNFSYPGYTETLTGIADPRVDSNDNVPNPNPTVFTWLNAKPDSQARWRPLAHGMSSTASSTAQRCGFPVNAGLRSAHVHPRHAGADATERAEGRDSANLVRRVLRSAPLPHRHRVLQGKKAARACSSAWARPTTGRTPAPIPST